MTFKKLSNPAMLNICLYFATKQKSMQQDDKVLYTEKVPAGKRTYFLDVKENHQGTRILKITESRKNDGEFIRHSIMIFQEDFDKIFDAFEKIKGYIQSTAPNKESETSDEAEKLD